MSLAEPTGDITEGWGDRQFQHPDDGAKEVGPWSDRLETAVLGCMIVHQSAAQWAVANLSPHHFVREKHRHIFKAICDVRAEGLDADLPQVCERLKVLQKLEWCGGENGIIQVCEYVVAGESVRMKVREYSQKLSEYYVRREIWKRCNRLAKHALEGTASGVKLLDWAYNVPRQLANVGSETYLTSAFDPSEGAGLTGVTTGLQMIDKHVGSGAVGYPRGNISMIGSRRGGGKTGFMVGSLVAARRAGHKVAYATLEMRGRAIANRMVQSLCGWDRCPNVDEVAKEWHKAVQRVRNWDIPMWDPTGKRGAEKSVNALVAWAIDLYDTKGFDILYVDYFQLLTAKGRFDNRTRELDHVADELMWLAQQLGVAVVVGSQLTKIENGGGVRAKDSIKIEDNAELVLYLTREKDQVGRLLTPATISVSKSRHGQEGIEDASWNRRFVRFEEVGNPPSPIEDDEQDLFDPFAD